MMSKGDALRHVLDLRHDGRMVIGSAVKTRAPTIGPTQWKEPPSTVEAIIVKAMPMK